MQRVAIGRALVRRPKALLMDEPIGALDAKLREEMRAELKRLHIENGTTSVYVTHDQVEAMALADRIAVMNDGVLQQVGTPSEVYLHPANLFVAQFVGRPVMNVVPVEVGGRRGRGVGRRRRRAGVRLPGRAARRGSTRRCRPGTSWSWACGPRRCWWRASEAPGLAAARGALHRAARGLRHRRPEGRRALPEGAHGQRLRAAAAATGCGRGSTRRRRISSTRPAATRCDIRLEPCLTIGLRRHHQAVRLREGGRRADARPSPTASSSCCSGRPARARPRRCG